MVPTTRIFTLLACGLWLALAGSTLPTAASDAVIIPEGRGSMASASPEAKAPNATSVTLVNLQELRDGVSGNVVLKDGDTVLVSRLENIYVSGQVENPGTYAMHRETTTVARGLARAGGFMDGATSRVEIVRMVDGKQKKMEVVLSATVLPGDRIVVP